MIDATLLDSCEIKLGGSAASDDILQAVEEVVVEDGLNLPAIITLRLVDLGISLIDDPSLAIGTELEVKLGRGDDSQRVGIGEITAIELDQRVGTGRVIVQAFDRSHRLHRGRHVRTFQQMTDGDVVNKIASEAGLQSDVDSTSTTHEYLIQDNLTDFSFISERALLTGMELTVDDRTVRFKKPNGAGNAPVELAWDQGLTSFAARITAADQVAEVEVRGWDPEGKQAISSSVTDSQAAPQIGLDAGQVRSGAFGSATALVTERAVKDASEAQALAQAALDHATGSIVLADGVAMGDPRIRAGIQVKLSGLGQRLSGTYFVTSTVHTVTPTHGYETRFSVRGRRRTTLVELSSANGHDDGRRFAPVVAVVTNVRDPNDQGRVKVKFPWLSDSEESAWARLVSPMAGPTRGLQLVPEVDDEVLVVFEHGDPNHPLILGALWNGKDATPLGGDAISGDGAVQQRVLLTRVGHKLLFDDSDASKSILIEDSAGNKITLDAANKKILVEGQGDIEVKATGTLKLEGQQVEVTASGGNVTVSGTQIKLN